MNGLAPVAGTVVALTVLTASAAAAEPVAERAAEPAAEPAVPRPASEPEALRLLTRAATASRTTSYQGVQFVSRWGASGATSQLVEIRHLPGEGTVMRVRGTASQPGGEIFAANAAGDVPSALSGTSGGPVALLARNYAVVEAAAAASVAGRATRVVELRRQDGTVAGRFWLDRQTGLILRREVFDSRGATVRASAFIELSLGAPAFLSHLPPMLPDPWRTQVSAADLAGLRSEGWRCPDGLPPKLDLYDVRRTEAEGGPVLHATYSDGLSTVSVFEQHGRLDVDSLDGYRAEQRDGTTVYVRDGVEQSIVWSADGTVYTLLADAPEESVQAVVGALPHEKVRSGVLARMERGLGRVASWMNPFG